MVIDRLKNLEGESRRHFLKWAGCVGALLAVDRARVLEVISEAAGPAMAQEASGRATNPSIHLVAGTGGFAWFQLLWPHVEVARANNDNFAWHRPGEQMDVEDSDKELVHGPESPWQSFDRGKRISAFMAGNNQTHTDTPQAAANINGASMLATVASIQRVTPSLLPVIGIGNVAFGQAPGAPGISTVPDAESMVQLFNSAASRFVLEQPQDAAAFEAYYKAFLGLKRAADKPTMQRALRVGKTSANFLGKNLAAKLQPTQEELDRYLMGDTQNKLVQVARTLITSLHAFELGLTQSVVLRCFNDDPHGAFGDMNNLNQTVRVLGNMLDQLMIDASNIADPVSPDKTLADALVMTVHGDTPKNPLDRSGWPDGTPNNSNWLYVMGNGYTKTGWHGRVRANGQTDSFDPATGQDVADQQANTQTAAANAAVAFAVARGDMRRVQDFFGGNIDGIVNVNPVQ